MRELYRRSPAPLPSCNRLPTEKKPFTVPSTVTSDSPDTPGTHKNAHRGDRLSALRIGALAVSLWPRSARTDFRVFEKRTVLTRVRWTRPTLRRNRLSLGLCRFRSEKRQHARVGAEVLRGCEHVELRVSFGVQRHELADAEECPRSLKFGVESFHFHGETSSVANEYRGYDLSVSAGRNGHRAQCNTKGQVAGRDAPACHIFLISESASGVA
jgi:hypothetical protein